MFVADINEDVITPNLSYAVTAKIEKSIAEGKLVVRVDTSDFYSYYILLFVLYEEEYFAWLACFCSFCIGAA